MLGTCGHSQCGCSHPRYHHPLQIAKQYGTLDRLSGGRLILGVGIGSLTAEFDLLGAQWDRRAARADDAIAALCRSAGRRMDAVRTRNG